MSSVAIPSAVFGPRAPVRSRAVSAERSDEELMLAYVDGDEAAFRLLFERWAPVLHGLTRRHLRDEELAREVTQQTFTKLHRARNDFRRDAEFRPWLLTIAMNLVREHWRRSKRRQLVELDESRQAAPEPARGRLELEQRARALHDALALLPDTQREVVELHYFQERPYKEVAAIVGTSEGAVRVRAHRAYRKLESLLQELVSK